jgi:hypothetical protein
LAPLHHLALAAAWVAQLPELIEGFTVACNTVGSPNPSGE